jgi:hypothetical protein
VRERLDSFLLYLFRYVLILFLLVINAINFCVFNSVVQVNCLLSRDVPPGH